MWFYYSAILLVVVSNVLYHIAQKSTPTGVSPLASLLVTYLTAATVCLVLFPFFPERQSLLPSLKKVNWASVALGVSIVGLEMGFLLAYRAGWNISLAQVFATILVSILLIPIGVIFFHESITLVNALGIVLCFGGVLLIARG
jgi:drug/metabolite transporter (DMT)-like permease